MTELSMQYACSPATGDYGPLTVENLAVTRLFLGNLYNQDSGVIFWRDSTYVPQISTTATPGGLSNPVDGLLEPTEAGGVVTIDTGVAIVNGYLYFNDDTVDFDIDASPGNANATDIIALRWTAASQTIRLTRLAGAAGSTAVLTQTTTTWDIPIVEVALDGSGQFSALTDVRKLAISPGTMMKISDHIGDGSTDIAFNSIPPIFSHLRIIGNGRTNSIGTVTSQIFVNFNSDVGTNYSYYEIADRNSATIDELTGSTYLVTGRISGNTGPANYSDSFIIDINNYKNNTLYKSAIGKSSTVGDGTTGVSGLGHSVGVGWWLNTSAITDIDITFLSAGKVVTGSVVSLYGIV